MTDHQTRESRLILLPSEPLAPQWCGRLYESIDIVRLSRHMTSYQVEYEYRRFAHHYGRFTIRNSGGYDPKKWAKLDKTSRWYKDLIWLVQE